MVGRLHRDELFYIAEYIRATRNEIAIDLEALDYAQRLPDRVGYIPRPAVWLGRTGGGSTTTRGLSLVLVFIWRWTFGVPFYLLQALLLVPELFRTRSSRSEATHALSAEHVVGIAFSSRAYEVVRSPQIENAPSLWLLPPWVSIHELRPDSRVIPLMALISASQLFNAVRLSIIATRRFSRLAQDGNWLLQLYTAVQWFIARQAVARCPAHLIIAEHFDRWAVLADVAARANARQDDDPRHRGLTVVQHGSVHHLDARENRDLGLNYRLAAVSRLYVYDDASLEMFAKEVLTKSCFTKMEPHYLRPQIEMTGNTTSATPRILFVGHPLCSRSQIEIYRAIKPYNWQVFYKPHPLAGISAECKREDWVIIEDPFLFPRVEILVAYASTLVMEYESAGIPAKIHPMTYSASSVDEVVEQLRSTFL
ncbi:hypothetical protein CYK37_07810 [Mesorhizobium loti]|nr:hypothetical protein [Mesorhizobium loti]PLP60067.1 hypothetical protein CYK37_07810 [Mesorhizobium loti]